MPEMNFPRSRRTFLASLASTALWLGGLSASARAQATGSLDPGFDSGTGFGFTSVNVDDSLSPRVSAVAVQPDGKILVGGRFDSYNGVARGALVRLNPDGSVDTTFNAGLDVPAENFSFAATAVGALALQSDGKILAVLNHSSVDSEGVETSTGLARFNADGSADTTFDATLGSPGGMIIALQPDGKIVVVTPTTVYQGQHTSGGALNIIDRLNTDGSGDASFTSGTVTDAAISTLAVQADGKILLGGSFVKVYDVRRPAFARLNADGSLDTAFHPRVAASTGTASVTAIAVQADGQTVISGAFATVRGVARAGIARISVNGRTDASFDPGTGPGGGSADAAAVQADGRIVLGGGFKRDNGTKRHRLLRLNTDGSLDTSFNPHQGPDTLVLTLALQTDGKIVIGGNFTAYGNVPIPGVARVE